MGEAFEQTVARVKDQLKKSVDEHTVIDVGAGVAKAMGVSEERFRAALLELKKEGYHTHSVGWSQNDTINKMKVLSAPGVDQKGILTLVKKFRTKLLKENNEEATTWFHPR